MDIYIYIHTYIWIYIGAVHKVRHARGGRVPRRCDSLWQGEGSRACDATLL